MGQVQKREVCVEFVLSESMVEDVMTKNQSIQKVLPLQKLLGMNRNSCLEGEYWALVGQSYLTIVLMVCVSTVNVLFVL